MSDIVERLGYHHEHPVHGRLVLINPDGPKAAAEINRLTAEVAEYEAMFDAAWEADMRGVQMWREAHPGNDMVLPDRANFTAWILAEIVVQRAENEQLRAAIECALRQLADGNRVLATGTLADALSGDKQ